MQATFVVAWLLQLFESIFSSVCVSGKSKRRNHKIPSHFHSADLLGQRFGEISRKERKTRHRPLEAEPIHGEKQHTITCSHLSIRSCLTPLHNRLDKENTREKKMYTTTTERKYFGKLLVSKRLSRPVVDIKTL